MCARDPVHVAIVERLMRAFAGINSTLGLFVH
jgi:hypothetical protein